MNDMKVKTKADLDAIRARVRESNSRLGTEIREKIMLCTGGGCIASGSLKLKASLEQALERKGLTATVPIVCTGCLGPCAGGPVVVMEKDKVYYQHVSEEDADDIVTRHILGGEVVDRLTWKEGPEKTPVPVMTDIEFFKRQTKIVLRNSGKIDPCDIDDYIGCDGYQALAKALITMTPQNVIDEMMASGLRGRGGAGFPTGLKWSFTNKAESDVKYVLCNADEGDPGAFMDRSVLEGDPHSLIEGMVLGAYAMGAQQGYVYVRAEYPLAVERLEHAIKAAREYGILGKNLFGTNFSFDLDIRMGAGAFVCGEETALIHSIEGKRGEPRPRPPFPAEKGLWGKPSSLNNVETFANVAPIVLNGGDWFASYGTEHSKGTKVFALAGTIENAGLVEVPIGTPLGEMIYEIGGGIPEGRTYKAAQIGGPSGGCIPIQNIGVELDYKSLSDLGAIMGSGGLIVMDDHTCMVDVARFFLEFVQEESCGQCVPCREGTGRMLHILERICSGKGVLEDIDTLEELGQQIIDTSLCGLGQTAPNPVLSTIRHFRHEYEAHIHLKQCDAGVCPGLVRAPCQSGCPANVDVPGFVSLVGEKRYDEALTLHRERNPFASVCARVCFHPCETQCRRSTLDDTVSIRGVKRFMVEQETDMQVPEVIDNEVNAARKVAIIGGGPAGLTCAYFLARMGYKPEVFEAEDRAGGMLVQTIPSYRLPRVQVEKEIEMITKLGVTIHTNTRLGTDFTLSELKEKGYDAAFLSMGAPIGSRLNLPGADAEGVTDAIEFLWEYNKTGTAAIGKKVIVVGGGNAAIDAARSARRLGAEVTVVYRRTKGEMPAHEVEVNDAVEEGVILDTLTNPDEVMTENGTVAGIKCTRMALGDYDKSGRRKPLKTDESYVIETDQIIFAIGQKLDCKSLLSDVDVATVWDSQISSGLINGQTNVPWIFAGGDAARGPSSVVEAVADGEKAAFGIDSWLTGDDHAFWRKAKKNTTAFDPDAEPDMTPRAELPMLSVDERVGSFIEVETPWAEEEAISQCKRCLRCDYGKN